MKLINSTIEGKTIIFEFEGGQILEAHNWGAGDKYWYLNGKCHREDGPAVETSRGDKSWYLMGKLHREEGPAIEWANGHKVWYLMGKKLTEDQFNQRKPK